MKKILTILLLFSLVSANSQKLYPLKVEEDVFTFRIRVQNHQPLLEQQGESSLFNAKKDFPQIEKVELQEGDLALFYKVKAGSDLLSYSFTLELLMPDGSTVAAPANELSDQALSQNARMLRWMDVTELTGDFASIYTLKVTRSLMGAVNCEGKRPVMGAETRVISYVGASVGVMSIVLGQIYRSQKESDYNRYQRLWADGAPDPGARNNPLDSAKKNDRNAQIFTWGGAGMLVASAVFYRIHAQKTKRKQQHYDKFCGKGKETSFNIGPGRSGIGIVLNF